MTVLEALHPIIGDQSFETDRNISSNDVYITA